MTLKAYLIKPITPKKPSKLRFFTFDVETNHFENPENPQFVLGSMIIYSKGKWNVYKFRDRIKMRDLILTLLSKGYFGIAHNLYFDTWFVFYDEIFDYAVRFSSKPNIIWFKRGYLFDLMNIFPMKLEKVGKLIGTPKTNTRFKGMTHKNDREYRELMEYCINDSYIVFKAYLKIVDRFKVIPISLSDLSMKYYRMKYLKQKVYRNVDGWLKNFYFGGRTEPFYIGYHPKINYYDINSLYPFVMRNNVFPTGKLFEHGSIDNLVMAYIKIKGNYEFFYPISPVKNGKLLFPNFEKDSIIPVSKPELDMLIEKGVDFEIVKGWYNKSWNYLFTEFVDELYELKKNAGDEFERKIYKLILNSLYGKFAEILKTKELFMTLMDVDERIYEYAGYYEVIGEGQIRIKDKIYINKEIGYRYNPVISILITSYARSYLYQFIERYDALYCDTDSIFTTKSINEVGNEIGQWKLEYSGSIDIYGSKFYRLGDGTLKAKGLIKTFERYEDEYHLIGYGKKLITMFEALRRRMNPYSEIEVKKKFRKYYTDKRLIRDIPDWTQPLNIYYYINN